MKIAGLILAAGLSSRMNGHLKPILKINGKTFIECIADCYRQAGINEIYVVVGHKAQYIRDELGDKPFHFVENTDYLKGQFSSLQAGVRQMHGDGFDHVLMQPADLPLIKPETIETIIQSFQPEMDILKPQCGEKRGHPVLFNQTIIDRILKAPQETITSEIFSKKYAIVDVTDSYILKDFDFYEDFIKIGQLK